jgi:hypothetical protein
MGTLAIPGTAAKLRSRIMRGSGGGGPHAAGPPGVCVYVCACVRACVSACVFVCVCVMQCIINLVWDAVYKENQTDTQGYDTWVGLARTMHV